MYLSVAKKIDEMISTGYSFGGILGYIRDLRNRGIIYRSEKMDLVNYLRTEMKARTML